MLRISSILKAGDDQIRLERKLTSELIKNWRESYDHALKEIFKRLPKEITQPAIEIITNGLAEALGPSFGSSQKVRDELRKYITKAYQSGKSEFMTKASLNLANLRAIDILARHNCYWLGEHYGKHIGEKIAEVTQEALADGVGRSELAKQLRESLGGEVGGYKYWDVVSSAALVRSRSFGCISGMVEAGITEYEILAMGDERMCDICAEMNGRIFSVSETQKVIDRVLDISDPDKFKEVMPWQSEPPKNISNDSLSVLGMTLPPFHGRCRCIVVMVSENIPEAHSVEEANEIAIKRGVAHNADFEGLDVSVANEFIKSAIENRKIIPELGALDFVGNAEKLFEFNCCVEFEKRLAKFPYLDENELFKLIVDELSQIFYRGSSYAIATPTEYGRGIGLFSNYFSSECVASTNAELIKENRGGWSPLNCTSIKSVMDHEFGHQIDYLFDISSNAEVQRLFSKYHIEGNHDLMSSVLSKYANENIHEFIAETWTEYRNNVKPREISQQVIDIITKIRKEG